MSKLFDRAAASRQSRVMRIASFIMVVILWSISSAAVACSCVSGQGSVEGFVAKTEVIFHGNVTQAPALVIDGQLQSEGITTFRVIRAYKGLSYTRSLGDPPYQTIKVHSRLSGSSCGIYFEPETFHLIKATRGEDGIYTTNLCQHSAFGDAAMLDHLSEVYGSAERQADCSVNVEQELCYVKIKQAYDAETFTGKYDLEDDDVCRPYKEKYDSIFRSKKRDRRQSKD